MNDSSMNDSYLKEIVSKNRKKNSESDDDSEGYSDQENVEKKPIINLLDESQSSDEVEINDIGEEQGTTLLPEQTQNDILTDLSVMVEQNADLKNEKLEEHLLLDGEKRVVKEEDSGLEKIASLNQEQVGFRTDVIAMITDENQSKKESTVSSKLNTIELGDVDDNSRKNETGSFFPGTESSEKQKQVGGEFLNKTIVNIENSNTEVEAKNSKFKLIEKKMAALEGITQTKEPEQILEILQEIRTIIQTEPRDPDLEPSLLDILKLKEQQLKQKFDLSKECTQETEKKSVTDNDSEVLINQVDHMETDNVLSQLSQVIEAKTTQENVKLIKKETEQIIEAKKTQKSARITEFKTTQEFYLESIPQIDLDVEFLFNQSQLMQSNSLLLLIQDTKNQRLILKKIGPAAETQQSMEAVMIPLDSSRVEKVFLSETFEEKYCVIVFIRKDHSLTLRIICIEEGKGSMIINDMNLVIRNPASPELICQSGNLIYFKSGTTIRCLQIRAKEFFNALLSQTRNPLKLGFIQGFKQVADEKNIQDITSLSMSTSRKLLVAQTEEQTPLMLMTSNLEKDLSPSGNADFYVSISSSLVLTVWLMDSQSSTSNKFALFRTFNLQKWLKIETLGLFESQILQDSKLVAVHIIKLNLIIFLRVNPSFHDSENSQGQVFFDRFKIISIPEYLKPYSLQVGEDGLAIGTFNSGSSKIEQYLIPNSIDWSTEDIISALQLENYVEPSGIITNRDELSELKKSQKTEGCSVNQVSILAGQGNYSAEQPETSEKNVSKKKNRTKKKKEGKSLENSQETEKDLHSVLKQDIQPVVTQAIKTTQNTTQTPVVQLKDEKTKPSKENEKKSKTPERTVVQRLNESENQKTKDMTNRDHNSEKSTPVHTKKLMNQNQQNSKNSKQQAKSAKNKKYDPDAFTQSDEYEKVVPKNNQNDAKQKQSQQKIVQEQKSKNEKNDKISDQPKNKIQDSKTSLNSTIQQNQNVSQQNVKNIVVPTINHQSQLSTQGLINHDNQLDLMRELLGNNVESLDSKIQEFYEIVQKSESSKKDQLTKLTEFLANLEKDLLAAVETSMDKNVQDQFRAAFETLVLPVFEKYLSQLFNKTDLMFNRGFKYYANKINIEQNKLDQFKEQLSQVAASFLTTSKSVKAVMQETEIVQKALVKTANDITESQTDLIEKKLEKLESNQDKILTMLEKISSKLETVEKKVDQVENWQVKFSEELSTQQRLKEMQKQSSKEKKSKSSKTGVQPEQKTIEQMLQNTSINHQFSAPTIGTMPYGYGQQIPAQNFQYQNLHQIHATPMMNHLGLHQSNSTQGYLLQNLGHVHPQIPTHQLQPNSIPIRASLNAAELEALYSQQIQQHQHQNSASNLQSKDILDKLSQILEQNKEAKNDTSISSSSEHG